MANLVTNPGFETDTTGWTARNNATITRDTGTVLSGTASGKIVTDGSTANGGAFAGRFNITANVSYTFTFKVKGTSGVAIQGNTNWFDGSGLFMDGSTASITLDGTTQTFTTTQTFPTGAAQATIIVQKAAIGVSTFWIDDVSLDLTSVPSVTISATPMSGTGSSVTLASFPTALPGVLGATASSVAPSLSLAGTPTSVITVVPFDSTGDFGTASVLIPFSSGLAQYQDAPYNYDIYRVAGGLWGARRRQEGSMIEFVSPTPQDLVDRIAEYEDGLAAIGVPVSPEWGRVYGATSDKRTKLLSLG